MAGLPEVQHVVGLVARVAPVVVRADEETLLPISLLLQRRSAKVSLEQHVALRVDDDHRMNHDDRMEFYDERSRDTCVSVQECVSMRVCASERTNE